MQVLPSALTELIDALAALPGVGSRTAERYAYFLLRNDPVIAHRLGSHVNELHNKIDYCPKTFALIEIGQSLSPLYTDSKRDKKTVAVVAEPFDIIALEKTGHFTGTYHVLGGLISPIDGVTPEQLHIKELLQRIDEDKVKEVIMATNASVEGESTALYIQQQIDGRPVKITRLAQGLPIGVDLEYADQITLGRALQGRQVIK